MSVVNLSGSALTEGQYDNIREDEEERLLDVGATAAAAGGSYAALVKRHGIVNFVFRYSTGSFHAINADGKELACGETIRQLLKSL